VGDLYPSAEILGLDLSPNAPSHVPPNVRFVIDDIEHEEWSKRAFPPLCLSWHAHLEEEGRRVASPRDAFPYEGGGRGGD